MSKGRKDYTWGFVLDYITLGRDSVNFHEYTSTACDFEELCDVFDYTVPAGYCLYLTGIYISCVSPADQYMEILKNLDNMVNIYFTLNYFFTPGTAGTFIFDEGDSLRIRCMNHDPETIVFKCTVIGILEEKT